jgi:hypothetical protein
MGACSVVLGAILSPAVIYGPAIGSVNSFPLVLVLVLVVVDATICATDMVRRYALPIWCDDMQGMKTEKAKSNMLLALML